MAVISNGTTIIDAGDISVAKGALTHIKTLTASSSATLSFVDGSSSVVFDGTYKEYIFKFVEIHPSSDANRFLFQGSTNTGGAYGVTVTSTFFKAFHNESGSSAGVSYDGQNDLAQSTNFQELNLDADFSADADHCLNGELHIYTPSNTTHAKHFIGFTNFNHKDDYNVECFFAGYFNTTSAVDAIQFKMNDNNIDSGLIKLYGVS